MLVCEYKVCVCGFETPNQTATSVSDTFQLNGRKWGGERSDLSTWHSSISALHPSVTKTTGLGHSAPVQICIRRTYTYSLLIPSSLFFLFSTFYLNCIIGRRKVSSAFSSLEYILPARSFTKNVTVLMTCVNC